jgi:hypothetical protein
MIENLYITFIGLIAVCALLALIGFIAEKRGWK